MATDGPCDCLYIWYCRCLPMKFQKDTHRCHGTLLESKMQTRLAAPLRYTLSYSSQTWSHATSTICFKWIACSSCLCPKLLSTYICQRRAKSVSLPNFQVLQLFCLRLVSFLSLLLPCHTIAPFIHLLCSPGCTFSMFFWHSFFLSFLKQFNVFYSVSMNLIPPWRLLALLEIIDRWVSTWLCSDCCCSRGEWRCHLLFHAWKDCGAESAVGFRAGQVKKKKINYHAICFLKQLVFEGGLSPKAVVL